MTQHHVAAAMAQVPEWGEIKDVPRVNPNPDHVYYISGPMSGYEGHNYAVFAKAKHYLQGLGYHIESPADHGYVDGWDWWQYIIRDMEILRNCHGIIVLPYFYSSPGACIEVLACQRMEYPVFRLDGPDFVGTLRSDGALNYEPDDMDVVLAHGEA